MHGEMLTLCYFVALAVLWHKGNEFIELKLKPKRGRKTKPHHKALYTFARGFHKFLTWMGLAIPAFGDGIREYIVHFVIYSGYVIKGH